MSSLSTSAASSSSFHGLVHLALAVIMPFVVGAGAALVMTQAFVNQRGTLVLSGQMASVKVKPPEGLPVPGNESIQIALALYGVEVPPNVEGPNYDENLEDRGLTTGEVMGSQKTVSIGPAAFLSWGILGSTLAHEIEVHVKQSFLKIVLKDQLGDWNLESRSVLGKYLPVAAPTVSEMLGNGGTWGAEREAYLYELRNARRFGLSQEEKASIKAVMDHYYPKTAAQRMDSESKSKQNLSSWMQSPTAFGLP